MTNAELDELRQVTDAFVEQSRIVTANDEIFDLEPGHSATSPQLRRIVRGKPNLGPRMKDLPVRLSLPRVEGGSIYEQQEKLHNPLLKS